MRLPNEQHSSFKCLFLHKSFNFVNSSAEEVEKCKQKHMLEDMLEEMAEEFPTLKQVFVVERDMYLCHSLQVAVNAVSRRGECSSWC